MTLRRGWCPGALTPMETGDGWLVRIRPRAGRYTLAQVQAIADVANTCGNGEIDLTNRANLQLRGLTEASLREAITQLAGVGLVDDNPALEQIRNVIVSPLAGLGPNAAQQAHTVAAALEAVLASDLALVALPGKFGFAVDTAAAPFSPSVRADIFLTIAPRAVTIRLAGSNPYAAMVHPTDAIAACYVLAHSFLRITKDHPALRRMRDAVAAFGPRAIYTAASLAPVHQPLPAAASPPAPSGLIGPVDAPYAVSAGLPYGRIAAPALARLIEAAQQCGVTAVHPSPDRRLVFPLTGAAPDPLMQAATELGLILSPADPRLAIDVCPGAPACSHATTLTRQHADTIASALEQLPGTRPSVHVSGCSKGCARSDAADLTFVGNYGFYDLVAGGRAADPPTQSGLAADALGGFVADLTGVSSDV